ncbi:MAG TPA: hypothetical protein VL500_04520 [Candidatus Eisenbacteria bacterium]|nr:hypothetical protein [Candidatus Eisenbacteria bacterium]
MGLWIPLVLIFGTVGAVLLGLLRSGKIGRRSYSNEDRPEAPGPAGSLPDFSGYPCGHEKPDGPSIVEVYGVKIAVEAATVCPDCIEEYLNRYSTRCASCRQPILPGMPVGQAWKGSPFPHTHMTMECTESGGLYCGRWGQGRLVTLHELEPDKFPPGTPNVVAHVYKTGKPTSID